jgi:hypothetical protein
VTITIPEPAAAPYPVFCPGVLPDGTPTAVFVCVKELAAADKRALADLLDGVFGWPERVRLILDEVACQSDGTPPTQAMIDEWFPRFPPQTVEKLHRAACAANGLPHLPIPTHYLPPPTPTHERKPDRKRR